MNIVVNYEYSNIKYLVETSYTRIEVIQKLGLQINSSAYKTLNKYLSLYKLENSFKQPIKIKKVKINKKMTIEYFYNYHLIENSKMLASDVRKRLIEFKIKNEICENCGILDWQDKKLTLQLHHINGSHTDNRIDNLQILCPNCHSQTKNFGTRNIKHKIINIKQCSCGKIIHKTSISCQGCNNKKHKTKINWPSVEYIVKQLKIRPFIDLAQELGVSDNAIRKHLKNKGIVCTLLGRTHSK